MVDFRASIGEDELLYNESVDVYSWAIVMWEVLNEEVVFGRGAVDLAQLVTGILQGQRPPVNPPSDSFEKEGIDVSRALISDNVGLSLGSNDQKKAAKEPNSFCNSLALFELFITLSILPRCLTTPAFVNIFSVWSSL